MTHSKKGGKSKVKIEWRNITSLKDLGQVKRHPERGLQNTYRNPCPESYAAVNTQGLDSPSSIHLLFHWVKPEPLLAAWRLQYCNMDSEVKLEFLCYLPSPESEVSPGDYSSSANRSSPDTAVLNKQILLALGGQNLDSRFSWIWRTHCYMAAPAGLRLVWRTLRWSHAASHSQAKCACAERKHSISGHKSWHAHSSDRHASPAGPGPYAGLCGQEG